MKKLVLAFAIVSTVIGCSTGGSKSPEPLPGKPLATDFGGATPIDPASWITPQDYPPAALRAHAQGEVLFAFDISSSGRVENCRITESSGNAALDATTCALIIGRGRFKVPVKDGVPQPTKGHSGARWMIP